jgi:hypothetical protein
MHYDVNIAMDVKKIQQLFRIPIHEYYDGCKKIQQLLKRPICGYYNGCKKKNYLEDLYASTTLWKLE